MLHHRLLACRVHIFRGRTLASRKRSTLAETDELGVPLQPTWSVRALLESYPQPTLSPEALAKLHRLSALIPPVEGTPEHTKLTAEMEDLIKLVEAVRVPELTLEEKQVGIPDGRIWAQDRGIDMEPTQSTPSVEDGRELLQHAAKTEKGLYIVEADRTRASS
jgi:hypothetical protein